MTDAAATAALLSATIGNPQKLSYPPNASGCVTHTYSGLLLASGPLDHRSVAPSAEEVPTNSVLQINPSLTRLHLYKSISSAQTLPSSLSPASRYHLNESRVDFFVVLGYVSGNN